MMRSESGKGASFDAMALTLIKLMTICLGFAITRLLSQYLSTYDYGTYSQILLIVSTVSSLTILGMMDGVNYFHCREKDPDKREAYIATLFAMQCAVGVAVGGLLVLFKGVILDGFENPGLERLIVFAAILPLLQNLVSMLQVLMVSVGKARMIAVRNLAVSLVRLAAVFVVVMLVRNVAVILTVTVILDVLQIGVFLLVLRRNGCLIRPQTADFQLSRQILSYCVPMAVFTTINALNRDCDKYMIALMTDTQTLAVYSNASKALPFDAVTTSFCTVLLPQITRMVTEGEHRNATVLYRRFLEIAYISTGILCCAALSAAPQLMELLYSQKYVSGLPVFCIYILADMIRFTNITLILCAAGKTNKLMFLGMGAFGINLVLNWILFGWIGVTGPAIATFLTTFGVGVMMLRMSAAELGAGITAFFDMKYLVLFVLENIVAIAVLSGLQKWMAQKGIHYFVILVIVCLVYCICLFALNGKRLIHDLKSINRVSSSEK